jgi:hypothetical protein
MAIGNRLAARQRPVRSLICNRPLPRLPPNAMARRQSAAPLGLYI